ncbi:HlyD family secretion protein [Desulfovibrio aminophilus]|nr:HlyD family secretion protein [Desulfovibrio aminophilus]MCM0755661.1 HlyD family secretion protein [Desulfovibrio aminophilus]
MKDRRLLILLVLACIGLAWGGYLLATRHRVSTDDAYVDGRIYTITPRVAGYVAEVLVEDNQEVKAGDPLVRLDPVEYEVALADARASLAALEEDATAAEQDLHQAKAQFEQAALDLRRSQDLLRTQAVSQSSVDTAQTAATSAMTRVRAAQAKLDAIRRRNAGAREGGPSAAVIDSRVEAAKAKVKQAALNLEYTTITAPGPGFVTKKSVEPGLMVSRGQPLMSVVPLHVPEIWVTANYKETDLTDVRPGQPCTFEVDTYPGVTVKGHVDSIQAGTGSVFALFPPENASGNFVKVVQRIPVKIAIEPGQDIPRLRAGMSVVPTIRTVKKDK